MQKIVKRAISLLLTLALILPVFPAAAAAADDPVETTPASAASLSMVETPPSWDLRLTDWKIAPEDAISIAPWTNAGVGNARARDFNTENWIAAKAPGSVLGALIDAKKYDDLFKLNNSGERDVYFDINMQTIPRDDFAGWWWYSIDFDVPAEQIGKNFNLNLKQISYQGEVFINGTEVFNENLNITDVRELQNKAGVGANTGAGSNPQPPYTFNNNNIGDALGRPTGRVAYTTVAESGGQHSSVAEFGHGDWDKYKGKFVGSYRTYDVDITNHLQAGSNNIKIRVKRMFNVVDFGPFWHDWHPAAPDNNMGLNGPVTLKATGAARLDNPMATSRVLEASVTPAGNGTADLSLYLNVTNMTDKPLDAVINAVVRDPRGNVVPGLGNIIRNVTGIPAGYYNWDVPVLEDHTITSAELWWTLGAGDQPLYTVDYTVTVGGQISDTLSHRFAIRELTHQVNNYTAANNAVAIQVFVNHQPIVMKGGGFGALDMFYRHDDLSNRNLIEIVKSMGHNFWRDEGKFFSEDLYDMMDEAGLLLMTGFMCCDRNEATLSNANTWEPGVLSKAERMIIYESVYSQLRIIRRHAAAWIFLNGSDHPKSQSNTVTAASVERKMMEIQGRLRWFQTGYAVTHAAYQRASTIITNNANTPSNGMGMSHGYDTLPPGFFFTAVSPTDNQAFTGEGLNGGMQAFISEGSGGMGVPVLETLNKMIPKDNLWPYNKGNRDTGGVGPGNYNVWNYHNARGNNFDNLDVSNLWIENAYGASETIEEYSIRAQLYQYDFQRATHEALHMRRFNRAMGFVNWMLNSPRPSTYWNQFDFYFNPHGGTYGTAKGNSSVHIMYDMFDRRVHVMNNTRQNLGEVTATMKIYDIDGNQINTTMSSSFNLRADGVTEWRNPGNVQMRNNGFIPTEYNIDPATGENWFEKAFEPFQVPFGNTAQGRRAAAASGNHSPWNNDDITASLIRPTTDVYFVSLELKKGGELLSRNDYAIPRKRDVIGNASHGDRSQIAQSADLTQLNQLPFVQLEVVQNTGGLVDGGEMWQQTVTITNPSGDIAFGVELKAYTDATKAKMTPANYSDNLIMLFPGETRTVTVRHLADNLGGKPAYIGVDCYNNIINRKPGRIGNIYVPGDPDSPEWTAWGLPAQTQTSATTNIARNVGSTVDTVASNATGPNTVQTSGTAGNNNRPTRITNNAFVNNANIRSRSALDGSIADGAAGNNSNRGSGFATIVPGSAHYINLGSAQAFDRVITRWTEDNNTSWTLAKTGQSVPDQVRVQISAATGDTADWSNLLYDGVIDNTKARSMNVEALLDKSYTARHIRLIPDGVTGASDSYGRANFPGRNEPQLWHGGWDPKSGRINDHVPTRPRMNEFSLSSVEIYRTYNNLHVDISGDDDAKAVINGKTISAVDPSVGRTAPIFFGDAVDVVIEPSCNAAVYAYLDDEDISDKVRPIEDGKFAIALDALARPAELTIVIEPETFMVTFMVDGEVYDEQIVVDRKTAEKPDDPIKEGFSFIGWLLDGEVFDFDTPITADITLVADWEVIPVTSFRIDAAIIETVARGWRYNFGYILNEGAIAESVIWTLANPALGSVDADGTVTIFERTGTVVLSATETSSGLSHSIMLRIAS